MDPRVRTTTSQFIKANISKIDQDRFAKRGVGLHDSTKNNCDRNLDATYFCVTDYNDYMQIYKSITKPCYYLLSTNLNITKALLPTFSNIYEWITFAPFMFQRDYFLIT